MVREHTLRAVRRKVCACLCMISCLKLTGCDLHEQHGTLFLKCFKILRLLDSPSKSALAWVCILCEVSGYPILM